MIFLRWGVVLILQWIAVYGGADWLAERHDYRVPVHFDAELAIPFVPAAAVVYLSLFPMLWLSPLVLHDEARLRRFARSLAWLIVISGVGFLLIPATPAYPTQPVGELWRPIFDFADWLNLDYNMLPSLHVGMSVVCAIQYGRDAGRTARLFFWTWAVAICLSTLLAHQHHVADVVTGALCGGFVSRVADRD